MSANESHDLTAPYPHTTVADSWLDGSDWFGGFLCDACGEIVRREEIVFDRECPRCGITLHHGVLAYQIGATRYEVSVAEFERASLESFGHAIDEDGRIAP